MDPTLLSQSGRSTPFGGRATGVSLPVEARFPLGTRLRIRHTRGVSGINREQLKQHARHFALFAVPALFVCLGIIREGTLAAGLAWGLSSLPLLLFAVLVVAQRKKNAELVPEEAPQQYARFGGHHLADPIVPFLIPTILTLFLFVGGMLCAFGRMFGAASGLLILSIACGWTAANLIRQDAKPQWASWTPRSRGALLCAVALVPSAIYANWNVRTLEYTEGVIVGRTIYHGYSRYQGRTVSYLVDIQSTDGKQHRLKSTYLFDAVENDRFVQLKLSYTRLTGQFVAASYRGQTVDAGSGARLESRGLVILIVVLLGWSVISLFAPKRE